MRRTKEVFHLTEAEQRACAVLRSEEGAARQPLGSLTDFLQSMRYHGLATLLYELLTADETRWPSELVQQLRAEAVGRTMWELRHQNLLQELLDALVSEGIQPLLFKGTALAYSIYRSPATRTRGDTDLLIAEKDREAADRILRQQGFVIDCSAELHFIRLQASYVASVPPGHHPIDLHWGISNSPVLSRLFTYDELFATSVPLPKLSPHARTVEPVNSLLIACMHRARHDQSAYAVDGRTYYSGDRLIWLYDVHLLASQFTAEQWDRFVMLAHKKTLSGICREGLERAQVCFATVIPADVIRRLGAAQTYQRATSYLQASRLRQHWLDLQAVPKLRDRLHGAAELILPPQSYMRAMFPHAADDALMQLYVRRALRHFTSRHRSRRGSL